MILRPGGELDSVGVVLALLNAGLVAVFHLITRVLTKTESNLSLLFHATLVGVVCFGLAAIPSLESSLPTWGDLGLMVLLGLISTLGHFLFTVDYQYASASLLLCLQASLTVTVCLPAKDLAGTIEHGG